MAERRRDVLIWSATIAVMALVLLAPALWNGFPLIYPDTGGYLERPLLGTLEMGRSALYGAFLLAGAPLHFRPSIAIQALIMAWLIFLVLRAHGFARLPSMRKQVAAEAAYFLDRAVVNPAKYKAEMDAAAAT